jgi:hypothetical protein
MLAALVNRVRDFGRHLVQAVSRRPAAATAPSSARLVVDTLGGPAAQQG